MSSVDPYWEWCLTTDRDASLSPDSLRHLVRCFDFMAADWSQLGLQLGVPNNKLREIQANHAGHPSQSQLCLTDMFDWWLKNEPNPTRGQVITAVVDVAGAFNSATVYERHGNHCIETETETESDEPSQPQLEKKSGLRKIWSTFQRCTADLVKSALGKLSGLFAGLDVRRKYKKSKDVVRWWFEVEGDESKLRALEGKWGVIQTSTQWKLE